MGYLECKHCLAWSRLEKSENISNLFQNDNQKIFINKMGVKKLLNLILKLFYKFTSTIQRYLFSQFLPTTQAKTVTTSILVNLAAIIDRNCSIRPKYFQVKNCMRPTADWYAPRIYSYDLRTWFTEQLWCICRMKWIVHPLRIYFWFLGHFL